MVSDNLANTYVTVSPTNVLIHYEVHEGFHSYLRKEDAINEIIGFGRVSNGKIIINIPLCCYECIIPKGAKIIYGKYLLASSVVSDSIKIIKRLNI